MYDFYRVLHIVVGKMPKPDKYSLGEKLQQTTLIVLECLIASSYSSRDKKLALLQQATIKLDLLRLFIRLANEVKAIPNKTYIRLQEQLEEIGKMLGGWMRSLM